MIYLDYSATTKTSDEVLDTFIKCSKEYYGNANSLHKLGVDAKNLISSADSQIKKLLNLNDCEIIYTSGSSEANNLAIKGVCMNYKNRGKHIITSPVEHSSVNKPLEYLKTLGYKVDVLKLDSNGLIDLDNLRDLIDDDTILVSVALVNSETGIIQPIKEISNIVKNYPKCFLHSDITQAIGKINVDLTDIDLASFSAHKFYGIKGIGGLIRNKKVSLTPLIHGGENLSIYRSGTPMLPLIVSMSKALRLALENIDQKEKYVKELNTYLKEKLSSYDKVKINSNDYSIPHILNISVLGVKPEVMLHALEKYEIYISTKSACSKSSTKSDIVYALTQDLARATSSIRISLSYLTTKEELDEFIKYFNICYNELTNLKN